MKTITLLLLLLANLYSLYFNSASAINGLAEQSKEHILNEDFEAAANTIERAILKSPSQGGLYKLAGDIYAAQAQNASLFSAPGLAKKSLKSYQEAVKIDPDNTGFRLSLMQFYLMAPGIVGGDKQLGTEQATQISALNETQGIVAQTLVHLSLEDTDALKKMYDSLPDRLANKLSIKLAKANYLAQTEQESEALVILQQLSELDPSMISDEDDRLIPYKAMLQTGFIGLKKEPHTQQGADSFRRYLDNAPRTYQLAAKSWVTYFLGLSYAKLGHNELAINTYANAKKISKNKNLLKKLKSALKKIK